MRKSPLMIVHYSLVFEMELLLSGCVVINYLSMSVKLVFVGYKSLKSSEDLLHGSCLC